MKYLKLLFESFENIVHSPSYREEIKAICKQYGIKNYTINTDGSIDVDDNVNLGGYYLKHLPIKFNKTNRSSVFDSNFYCSYNYLTTLEGCPIEVNGDFYCNNNKLKSFEYAPKIIRGLFDCRNNNIKSFEYFPSFVKSYFLCDNNPIEEVWCLFGDTTKIELLNDFDIFRDEDTDEPSIFIERLNDFLDMIGEKPVKKVNRYKNI